MSFHLKFFGMREGGEQRERARERESARERGRERGVRKAEFVRESETGIERERWGDRERWRERERNHFHENRFIPKIFIKNFWSNIFYGCKIISSKTGLHQCFSSKNVWYERGRGAERKRERERERGIETECVREEAERGVVREGEWVRE